MRISFLLDNAYGVGGAIRATISTANALAAFGHEVQILSVKRLLTTPSFDIDPRVSLESIVDLRDPESFSQEERRLAEQPPTVLPKSEAIYKDYNALLETRVREKLSQLDTDVIIGTRVGLNTYIAEFAPETLLRVGVAHTTFSYYSAPSLADELKALSRLDALITVASGDVPVWQQHLKHAGTQIAGIANCVAPTGLTASSRNSKTIMAVGRLVGVKQFHLLIRAFSIVSAKYPDWKLRIYGRGAAKQGLRELIFKLGLHNRAYLMGAVTPIEPEWAKASIAAVTSRLESFHIGLVEAQQVGVPVVSMACERGPVDIITPDSDGILTPPNDVEAFAAGLLRVIENPELSDRLAARGLRTSERFRPEAIAKQYHKFLTKLVSAKTGRSNGRAKAARTDERAAKPPALDCLVSDDTGILEIRTGDRRLKQLVLSPRGKGKTLKLECKGGLARVPVTTALAEGTY
ncbi:MAG: glycosyltransferase, partial [Stackebrandtia sp.]